MKLIFIIFAFVLTLSNVSRIDAETRVVTHLKNTDHELTVYYVNGKEPGNTMLIIGGIQGDEPGGYLAADLYADIELDKGNLIVVPRANLYSIRLNKRGVFGDMNRKFAPDDSETDDHDNMIVQIIKDLMSQSDVLLNLHEGSGFYYPVYVSDMKQPLRYGQSIIIDSAQYTRKDGSVIDLEYPVKKVIAEMNRTIKNPEHHFHFNNHDTFSENTKHGEQRGSATYNALVLFEIPAYGIETSKSIDSIETKVKYETLAINSFMREYGIFQSHPRIYFPTPALDHLVVTIDGNPVPLAVKKDASISVPKGTVITVSSVVANYKRGLSVDILGLGNNNDIGRPVVINEPIDIKVYWDAILCGEAFITITDMAYNLDRISESCRLKHLEIKVDSKNIVVSEGDTLHIVRGDIIKITGAQTTCGTKQNMRINFYGFVGNKRINDAEDRGYDIDTARDLMRGYGMDGNDSLYRIDADLGIRTEVIGNVYIAIDTPEIEYLIVEHEDGTRLAITPGEAINCKQLEKLKILSIVSNVTTKPFIDLYVSNKNGSIKEVTLPSLLEIPPETNILFKRNSQNLGSVSFRTSGL
ncbi:hypothetical protein ES708_12574 [subsurface metagenome]